MKRGLTVAVAGAAIVVAGISGCSSNKPSSSGSTAVSVSGTSIAVGTGGGAAPTVTIDGKNQNVTGSVVCATVNNSTNITIGAGATAIAAVLTTDNPPKVTHVALGNVNGVMLGYTAGSGQGDASATKDGNSYKITGTATGVDTANPMQPVKKPFEIDVTCS